MSMEAAISLFLNSKGAIKSIQDFQKKFNQTIGAVKNNAIAQLGGIGTVVAGAFSVKNAFDEARQLADFSDMFNRDVEAASKFTNIIKAMGGTAQDSIASMSSLENAITQMRIHASGPLKSIGLVAGVNLAGVRDSLDLMEQLRGAYKNLSDSGKQAMLQEMGIFSPEIVRMMKMTDAEYQKIAQDSSRYGIVTEKVKKNVVAFNQTLSRFKSAINSVGFSLMEYLEKPLSLAAQALEWFASQSDAVKMTVFGLGAAIGSLSVLAPIFGLLKSSFLGITSGVALLGKVMVSAFSAGAVAVRVLTAAMIANPVGAILAGIASIAALVIMNWTEVKDWFVDFFKWYTKGAKEILSKIPLIGRYFKDEVGDLNANVEAKQSGASVLNPPVMSQMLPPTATSSVNNSTINNNTSSPKVTQTYNVNFYGANDPSQIEQSLNRVVRNNAGGVRY